MTEPTTPTGKRQWAKPNMGDYRGAPIHHRDILAIEHEAAAAVRAELMGAIDANLRTGGIDRHAHCIFYCMLTNEDAVLAEAPTDD